MNLSDFKIFANSWADAHEVMAGGKVLSESAMSVCFKSLEMYPLDSVLIALQHHVRAAKFAPTPNDIIGLLTPSYISADEAWAIVDKDESETIIWTDEMCQARAIVEDLILSGDKIGARMAFKGAYERLCNEAMVMGRVARWSVSMGTDKRKSRDAIQQSVSIGRISADRAEKLLPNLQTESVIVGLLFHDSATKADSDTREKWKKLKKSLNAGEARTEKRLEIISQKLETDVTEHERYLLNSELALLLDSVSIKQESEAKFYEEAARKIAVEESRKTVLKHIEEMMNNQRDDKKELCN